MIDTQQEAYIRLLTEQGTIVYYYEDKPYRVLHEGKVKAGSILSKLGFVQKYIDNIEPKDKWIDVVIYEPLYPECDIRICVKEKTDFYKNYKPKE